MDAGAVALGMVQSRRAGWTPRQDDASANMEVGAGVRPARLST